MQLLATSIAPTKVRIYRDKLCLALALCSMGEILVQAGFNLSPIPKVYGESRHRPSGKVRMEALPERGIGLESPKSHLIS